MEDQPTSAEMETLWRLAGQPWHAHALQPTSQFEKLRPRIHAAIVEMVLRQLERDNETVDPGGDDLLVLLASQDSRLRLLGIRLSVAGRAEG